MIDPMRVDVSKQSPTAGLMVRNGADDALSLQVQVFAWIRLDGKDVYTPTRDLLVSPPIVTIAPKSEQIIRAALRRPADATQELAYRIYLH